MSFSSRATVTASTKRKTFASSKETGWATQESSISCWPLAPVDGETVMRQNLRTAFEWMQTFVEGDYDIQNGDLLVIGSTEYPIGRCEKWPWRSTYRFRLFVHEMKS